MNTIKQCPYCAEDIKVEAIKCKHCGKHIPLEKQQPAPQVGNIEKDSIDIPLPGHTPVENSTKDYIDQSSHNGDFVIKATGWFFGIVFIISGISNLFGSDSSGHDRVMGLCFMLFGIFILPVTIRFFKNSYGFDPIARLATLIERYVDLISKCTKRLGNVASSLGQRALFLGIGYFLVMLYLVMTEVYLDTSISIVVFKSVCMLIFIWLVPSVAKKENFTIKRVVKFKEHKIRLVFSFLTLAFFVTSAVVNIRDVAEQVRVATYNDPVITILSSQGNQAEALAKTLTYPLEFSVTDADIVYLDGEEIIPNNDIFSKEISLVSTRTYIVIRAENEYKYDEVEFTITRDKSAEEIAEEERIAADEAAEEAEREKLEAESNDVSTVEIIEKAVANIGDYEVTVWTTNGDWADDSSTPPFEVIVNTSSGDIASCFAAKSTLFDIMKALYTNSSLSGKIVRVKFTAWGYLKASLGSGDSSIDWSSTGLSNFWTVLLQYNSSEDEYSSLGQRTYGVKIDSNCD